MLPLGQLLQPVVQTCAVVLGKTTASIKVESVLAMPVLVAGAVSGALHSREPAWYG